MAREIPIKVGCSVLPMPKQRKRMLEEDVADEENGPDLYTTLSIERDAQASDIKKAYYKLVPPSLCAVAYQTSLFRR